MASQPKRVKIGDVTLDAALSVRFSEKVTTTQHPIEEGASPTDHAREEPEDLFIEGILSSFPLVKSEREARGELERGGGKGYAEEQYKILRGYKSKRETLTVVTAQRTLKDMMLTQLDRSVDSSMGGIVRFTSTFKEVRFVKTENVRLQRQAKPNKMPKKPNGKVDQSKQPAKESSTERSAFKSITDATGATDAGDGVSL